MLQQPDILLLDEPTNHLDLNGVLWLEEFLIGDTAPCCVLLVSHDRAFVDRVCTDVIILQNQTLRYFPGNFSDFFEAEQQLSAHHSQLLDGRVRQEEKARAAVDRMKKGATSDTNLKQAKQKEKKIERMGLYRDDGKKFKLNSLKKLSEKFVRLPNRIEELKTEKAEKFKFPCPEPIRSLSDVNDAVLRLQDLECGYDRTKPILSGLNLQLSCRSRVAVVGGNGAGKSTLLNVILGTVNPFTGRVWRHDRLCIAAVHQHHTDMLEAYFHLTAAAFIMETYACDELKARTSLGRFGLTGQAAMIPMQHLSGGQLARVSLTSITWHAPHLLVMDEPTNHLDVYALDALADALRAFEGGIVLVSHNRAFCAAFCRTLWVVGEGCVRQIESVAQPADAERDEEADQREFSELFSTYEEAVMARSKAARTKSMERLQKVNHAAKKLNKTGKPKSGSVSRSALL